MRKSKTPLLILALLAGLLVSSPALLAQADDTETAPAGDLEETPAEAPGTAPAAPDANDPNGAVPPPGEDTGLFGGQTVFLVLIVVAFAFMMIMSSRSRKKQQQKRQEMIESLGKGDKIITIGGIVGTVIETRENEVVVKVDEQNNIRMRFAKWSVRAAGDDIKTTPGPEEER